MARARNIKPGFFTNEDLCELPPLTRLLFIGLWTEADREGRLEDRPSRIKMRVFPLDHFDVEEALSKLAEKNFITRYEVDGLRLIQISAWHKHQRPHAQEAKSALPEQKYNQGCISDSKTGDFQNQNTTLVVSRARKSEIFEDKIALIPDTGYLIPDSGREDSATPPAPPPAMPSLLDVDPTSEFRKVAEEIVQLLPAGGSVDLTANYLGIRYSEDLTYYDNPRGFADYIRSQAKAWRAGYDRNPSLRPKQAHFWVYDKEYSRQPSPPTRSSEIKSGTTERERLLALFDEVRDAS